MDDAAIVGFSAPVCMFLQPPERHVDSTALWDRHVWCNEIHVLDRFLMVMGTSGKAVDDGSMCCPCHFSFREP